MIWEIEVITSFLLRSFPAFSCGQQTDLSGCRRTLSYPFSRTKNGPKNPQKKAKSRLLQAANRFDRESTTLIASWWWLLLWTAYIGVALLEPSMAKEADHVAGAALLLILAVMAVSSVFEALEDRLGTMLMNCVISIPSVPLLPAANIGCMFFGADAWNLKQKTMCIGAQVPALALAFLHFLFTKKLWKREPPLRLQPKTPSQPYKPDLAGPVKWAFAYLTVVLFAAGLCGLVPAKRVFSNRDIPVFWLTTVLLIVLIAAACAILPLIDRKLSRR